jgi:hypothetical protein
MNMLRGWFGEKAAAFKIWASLESNACHGFHDVVIPSRNGTTRLGHLLVSPYGLFIRGIAGTGLRL